MSPRIGPVQPLRFVLSERAAQVRRVDTTGEEYLTDGLTALLECGHEVEVTGRARGVKRRRCSECRGLVDSDAENRKRRERKRLRRQARLEQLRRVLNTIAQQRRRPPVSDRSLELPA